MSNLKKPNGEMEDQESLPTVLVISDTDSDSGGEELTGFSSPQKRCNPESATSNSNRMDPPLAKKRFRIDTGETLNEELPIDIDSVSTNPLRTRTKVSSDTSSKFPVSSPSDTVPLAGHRKKYVKNTLAAGAEWRLLQEIALGQPAITYHQKVDHWDWRDELSDVEDVNNFDAEFQKREKFYSRSMTGRRSSGKDSPYPNYNYHHFRSVILETFQGSPVNCSQESKRNSLSLSPMKPTCSKELSNSIANVTSASLKPDSKNVAIYEKILCPSSESSATKASPSIRLHWTDEESVFRLNRLNPDIDKYSQLIKVRIDYKKQIDFKSKINEIFKTPTVPVKYNSPPMEQATKAIGRQSLDIRTVEETKLNVKHLPVREILQAKRSPGKKSSESRQSSERKNSRDRKSGERRSSSRRSSELRSNDRRSSERFPELSCFQQDEFCNYLGLGMNGKIYSPTPADNKRRSLRVKRSLVSSQSGKKINNDKKKDLKRKNEMETKEVEDRLVIKKEDVVPEVHTTSCTPSSLDTDHKILENSPLSKPTIPLPPMSATNILKKTPEIKIIAKLRNSAATPTKSGTTPSSIADTLNSTPPPTIGRRQRRIRATSNATSTCPRSSQSDESPDKGTPARRRRINYQPHNLDHLTSDLSESLQSDPNPNPNSNPPPQNHHPADEMTSTPQRNGHISKLPSLSPENKKDETIDVPSVKELQNNPECVHKKYQRYLEESRKTKPSIFIVESINNSEFKKTPTSSINNQINTPTNEHPSKEKKNHKIKNWHSNKKYRRLLRKNGTVIGTLNQRMLRNRIIRRSSRPTIEKYPKVKIIKSKDPINKKQPHISKELNKKTNVRITKQNKASQIDLVVGDTDCSKTKKQVQSSFAQVPDEDVLVLALEPTIVRGKENILSKTLETCDSEVQTDSCAHPLPINFLTTPSDRMPNPLTPENGRVIYAYYELDILTIVQDFMVTFWKTCKLIQVLGNKTEEWVQLGECKRLLYDTEIETPYKNRICVHNSIPIYLEMRAKELPQINRDCFLISVYVNVYYFDDEDLVAKSHSIQLDTVASLPQNVVYTTINDSRYFVMCWSQETLIGKTLSGLCKYSLTPHLDTLASIREFKSMRHEIRYLECTNDDNLIGFGDSQVTLWDHRSGDILMNYDLDIKIGNNLGSLHFVPLEVGQAKTVFIFQKTSAQELSIFAINVSHNSPSHQLVCKHTLPPEFDNPKSSIGIDDYTILTNSEHQELWIDHSDPQYMVQIQTPEGQRRFYSRCKQNVIVITENHLALETLSSFVLKMSHFTDTTSM